MIKVNLQLADCRPERAYHGETIEIGWILFRIAGTVEKEFLLIGYFGAVQIGLGEFWVG